MSGTAPLGGGGGGDGVYVIALYLGHVTRKRLFGFATSLGSFQST